MIKKLILAIGLITLASCGIKGPPLPPLNEPAAPVIAQPTTTDQTPAKPVKKTKTKKKK